MFQFKIPLLLTFFIPLLLGIFWLTNNSRAATETPVYQVNRTDGKFEVRDYPELRLATTTMPTGEMNSGFGQLFRFITGGNQSSEKIAMTTPVLIDTADEARTMSFIMPKLTVEKGLPKPSENNVTLGQIAPTRFAVFRFSGGRSVENEKIAITQLTQWLLSQKITAKGAPLFAYYDPPWTPTFMRRNEVFMRIQAP